MMNERIEQLLEQARAECFRFGSKPATTAGYDELEKFAELIVKECIDIVSPYAIRMENFDGGHPIADLKKHFGVES